MLFLLAPSVEESSTFTLAVGARDVAPARVLGAAGELAIAVGLVALACLVAPSVNVIRIASNSNEQHTPRCKTTMQKYFQNMKETKEEK